MAIAIALLAAGRGARFGDGVAKPLLELCGVTLLDRALSAAIGSGLAPILVVVGHRGDEVARAVPASVEVVHAADWDDGISCTLRRALEALDHRLDVEAVIVGLADQPLIGAQSYQRLATAYHGGAELAVATYNGQRANPVLLARPLWPEARSLVGDVGARALLRTRAAFEVDCTDTGDPIDVDTPDDLASLEERCRSKMSSG